MDDVPEVDDPAPGRSRMFGLIAILVAAAVVIVVLVAINVSGDDDETSSTSLAPATTEPATTTTAPTETTSPATTAHPTTAPATTTPATTAPPTTAPATTEPGTPPGDATRNAIFPTPDMDVSYDDPVEAAREFALAIGFADPVTGDFMAGDGQSGEVEVRAVESSPPSVVFVRQLDDEGGWYVLGATTESIEVDAPEAHEVVTSPLIVAGRARAFEGTVEVLLRADDVDDPLVEDFVTGSGGPDLGPFEGSFDFEPPDVEGGALLFLSRSSEDGSVIEVDALRVFFEIG